MNQEEASLRLKVWSTILLEGCWYLSSTTNQITLLPFVYLKQHVDWLELFMAWSEQLFVSRLQSQDCVRKTEFIPVHTLNGQPKHREEQFTWHKEFDKKYIGLEIANSTFNGNCCPQNHQHRISIYHRASEIKYAGDRCQVKQQPLSW